MRRIALAVAAGLLLVATTVIAAEPDESSGGVVAPLIDGQSLADGLMEWDGYDFTDAGDIWPGALRSGPSSASDPNDPFGGDGTIWILPPLDGPAHVLVEARLSELGEASIEALNTRVQDLQSAAEKASGEGDLVKHARTLADQVVPAMAAVREVCDKIEETVADEFWSLPKYREMLFLF